MQCTNGLGIRERRHVAKRKRKLSKVQKRAQRERKTNYMTIFVKGKQKRVRRPEQIEGLPVDEFIAGNADPIWLHQNEMWELMMTPDSETSCRSLPGTLGFGENLRQDRSGILGC